MPKRESPTSLKMIDLGPLIEKLEKELPFLKRGRKGRQPKKASSNSRTA